MKGSQAGYALIVILLFLALVLVTLSAAVPSVLSQGQREKEEELIFRGEQYKHAIGLYYKKFGRYPMKIEDLLETNDRAYLRRAYPDPMTKGGTWRLIRVGPMGELLGSTHERRPPGPGGGTSGSAGQTEGGSGAGTAASGSGSGSSSSGGVNSPIVGVASSSTDASIRVYDGYSRYNEWEFIYDPVEEAKRAQPAGTPGTTPTGTQPSPPPSGTNR